ncbi:MAG: hypothetical protein UX31_C0004G0020 [Candidatus Nomurabacteria bacterium GW2011_GWA1_46_11]|uniref:Type II toxin-antitoxin system RelE/ParE family toxin n=1 Tax=Candidatus Nomurabacteria bacterium GW2011_GWA1_46_11 TaxID=1618732 RepID=A0A0G1NPF1_9BACT|nr:MAG: hypothetical protein UX31_C0004G0020 [Candidatus Nomurabacteria bacterium GW2011_GWA1_46_11]
MDDLEKSLRKLTGKGRKQVKDILSRLVANDFRGLNLKKLRGSEDIFRVRKGDVRIIYRKVESKLFVLAIERRSEGTYRNF